MCDLGIGAAVGIGAASAAVNQQAQVQAADEQNRYRQQLGISQNQRYKENAEAVVKDVGLQLDQLVRRDFEQAAATRQELENLTRNARMAGASTRVATAAAGIEGRTVDLLHAEFERDIAEFESSAARNMQSFRSQANFEAQAIYARGQSAINGGYPNPLPPTATVSPLTNLMNGVTTGIAAYGAIRSFSGPPGVGEAANPNTGWNSKYPWQQNNVTASSYVRGPFSPAPSAMNMSTPSYGLPTILGN